MVYLERWFGYSLVLVLFLAEHQCMFIQEEWRIPFALIPTIPTITSTSRSVTDDSTTEASSYPQDITTVPPVNGAPPVFPKEEINGTKIITCKTTGDTIEKNETACLNTTDVKTDNTNNNASDLQLDDTINSNATEASNKKVKETDTENTTDVTLTSNDRNLDAALGLNETNVNNNETEAVSTSPYTTAQNNDTTSNETDNSNKTNICAYNPQVQSETVNNGTENVSPDLNATESDNTDSSKINPEIKDLLTSDGIQSNQDNVLFPTAIYKGPQSVDRDTEYVEEGHETEDLLKEISEKERKLPGVPLVQGQLAAILAGVFVLISIIAYLGLLSWRRYLENRYGNRQMLVNEDEFNDDLRHFSI